VGDAGGAQRVHRRADRSLPGLLDLLDCMSAEARSRRPAGWRRLVAVQVEVDEEPSRSGVLAA